mgnify:CR=1 FL=1
MTEIAIDKDLNKHLGLPESYQIDKQEAFKLYQYFMSLLETKNKIGPLLLIYYIDFNGGKFLSQEPTNKRDKIVRDIVDNMSMADQFEVRNHASKFPEPFDNDVE